MKIHFISSEKEEITETETIFSSRTRIDVIQKHIIKNLPDNSHPYAYIKILSKQKAIHLISECIHGKQNSLNIPTKYNYIIKDKFSIRKLFDLFQNILFITLTPEIKKHARHLSYYDLSDVLHSANDSFDFLINIIHERVQYIPLFMSFRIQEKQVFPPLPNNSDTDTTNLNNIQKYNTTRQSLFSLSNEHTENIYVIDVKDNPFYHSTNHQFIKKISIETPKIIDSDINIAEDSDYDSDKQEEFNEEDTDKESEESSDSDSDSESDDGLILGGSTDKNSLDTNFKIDFHVINKSNIIRRSFNLSMIINHICLDSIIPFSAIYEKEKIINFKYHVPSYQNLSLQTNTSKIGKEDLKKIRSQINKLENSHVYSNRPILIIKQLLCQLKRESKNTEIKIKEIKEKQVIIEYLKSDNQNKGENKTIDNDILKKIGISSDIIIGKTYKVQDHMYGTKLNDKITFTDGPFQNYSHSINDSFCHTFHSNKNIVLVEDFVDYYGFLILTQNEDVEIISEYQIKFTNYKLIEDIFSKVNSTIKKINNILPPKIEYPIFNSEIYEENKMSITFENLGKYETIISQLKKNKNYILIPSILFNSKTDLNLVFKIDGKLWTISQNPDDVENQQIIVKSGKSKKTISLDYIFENLSEISYEKETVDYVETKFMYTIPSFNIMKKIFVLYALWHFKKNKDKELCLNFLNEKFPHLSMNVIKSIFSEMKKIENKSINYLHKELNVSSDSVHNICVLRKNKGTNLIEFFLENPSSYKHIEDIVNDVYSRDTFIGGNSGIYKNRAEYYKKIEPYYRKSVFGKDKKQSWTKHVQNKPLILTEEEFNHIKNIQQDFMEEKLKKYSGTNKQVVNPCKQNQQNSSKSACASLLWQKESKDNLYYLCAHTKLVDALEKEFGGQHKWAWKTKTRTAPKTFIEQARKEITLQEKKNKSLIYPGFTKASSLPGCFSKINNNNRNNFDLWSNPAINSILQKNNNNIMQYNNSLSYYPPDKYRFSILHDSLIKTYFSNEIRKYNLISARENNTILRKKLKYFDDIINKQNNKEIGFDAFYHLQLSDNTVYNFFETMRFIANYDIDKDGFFENIHYKDMNSFLQDVLDNCDLDNVLEGNITTLFESKQPHVTAKQNYIEYILSNRRKKELFISYDLINNSTIFKNIHIIIFRKIDNKIIIPCFIKPSNKEKCCYVFIDDDMDICTLLVNISLKTWDNPLKSRKAVQAIFNTMQNEIKYKLEAREHKILFEIITNNHMNNFNEKCIETLNPIHFSSENINSTGEKINIIENIQNQDQYLLQSLGFRVYANVINIYNKIIYNAWIVPSMNGKIILLPIQPISYKPSTIKTVSLDIFIENQDENNKLCNAYETYHILRNIQETFPICQPKYVFINEETNLFSAISTISGDVIPVKYTSPSSTFDFILPQKSLPILSLTEYIEKQKIELHNQQSINENKIINVEQLKNINNKYKIFILEKDTFASSFSNTAVSISYKSTKLWIHINDDINAENKLPIMTEPIHKIASLYANLYIESEYQIHCRPLRYVMDIDAKNWTGILLESGLLIPCSPISIFENKNTSSPLYIFDDLPLLELENIIENEKEFTIHNNKYISSYSKFCTLFCNYMFTENEINTIVEKVEDIMNKLQTALISFNELIKFIVSTKSFHKIMKNEPKLPIGQKCYYKKNNNWSLGIKKKEIDITLIECEDSNQSDTIIIDEKETISFENTIFLKQFSIELLNNPFCIYNYLKLCSNSLNIHVDKKNKEKLDISQINTLIKENLFVDYQTYEITTPIVPKHSTNTIKIKKQSYKFTTL